jgi:hypothetical protein
VESIREIDSAMTNGAAAELTLMAITPIRSMRPPAPSHVASLLDIPHIEIDALFHGPGWTPRDTFESEVHRFSAGSCWVTEWQYSQVRAILAQ